MQVWREGNPLRICISSRWVALEGRKSKTRSKRNSGKGVVRGVRWARCGARAGLLHTLSCSFAAAVVHFCSLHTSLAAYTAVSPGSRFGPQFVQQQGHNKQEALLISSSSSDELCLLPTKIHLWAPAGLNLSGSSHPGPQAAGLGGKAGPGSYLLPCQHLTHPT